MNYFLCFSVQVYMRAMRGIEEKLTVSLCSVQMEVFR